MRNVLRIFKNDIRALTRHMLAFIIILAILVLPALYAWFNIYAFWDPYGKTGDIPIAVVCNDQDYMDDDGNIINIGNELVNELKSDDNFGFVFLDDADQAVEDVYAGDYYAAVIIDPDFTYNMYNFITNDMTSPTIKFYQNEKANAIAVKVVEAAADKVKQIVNEKYISAIVETLFDKLNVFSEGVQGDSTVDMLRNTLVKLNSNLAQYDKTISEFTAANQALVGTLKDTNGTLDYSIYLIGKERVNISKQVGYIESTQGDLALFNEEANKLLLGLQDSVQQAIYKLDRLYEGADDSSEAEQALKELEAQYQELIDYITHSGLSGEEVEDALSALNTLKEKITSLREQIGLNGTVDADASTEVENDYNNIAVPESVSAITSDPSLESVTNYIAGDASNRIDSIDSNLAIAQSATSESERTAALTAASGDASILEQEMSALGTAIGALETATGSDSTASGAANSGADSASDVSSRIDDILRGDRDIDLIADLELVNDALSSTRVALTETVYPALDTLLEGMQDSLGDVSSVLLDLSNVLGKVTPIVDELGNTFGSVNSALIHVQGLLDSYRNKISDVLSILNGDDDSAISQILDFFNVDPKSIGEFFSSPVSMQIESIYPVESYGTAMAPFYTMLAIWVGCVIINSIVKIETPIELIGATNTQRFFGRYLVFFLLSLIQTMVIMIGDIILLGVDCVHPGLFLLTGVVTSLTCSMLAYAMVVAFSTIGKFLFVIIMIIQIAGSGGSYPIELLPDFFQQVYLFFPFPYAINAMREAIAGLYQNSYLIYLLQLLLFFGVGLFIGLFLKKPLEGINGYMNDQLERTDMM